MDEGILLIVVAFISVTIGYLAGSLLSGREDRQEEKEPAKDPQPRYPPDALHIWRDNQQERLALQIGKHVFHSNEPLPPTEGKYMAGLLVYLRKWLGMAAAPMHSPSQGSQPAQPTAPPPGRVSPFVAETPEIPETEKSIVAQVDEILQELLLNSPLEGKGIKLVENLDGSMKIFAGLEQYDDIAQIPDETIQGAIRAAVQKWEKRQ